MQKNTFKKIISLTYLLIFIFSLFIPFNKSFAEKPDPIGDNNINTTLKIYGNSFAKKGETITITASLEGTTNIIKKENSIIFSQLPTGGTLNSYTCIPKPSGFSTTNSECSVSFISSKDVFSFKIRADVLINNKKYISNELEIKSCNPPKKMTKDYIGRNVCSDPAVVVKPETKVNTDTTYTPLAPLPGLGTTGCKDAKGVVLTDPKTREIIPCIDTQPNKDTNPCPFGNYLNIMIKLIIGMAAVLAMVMITMGGVEYMSSELVSGKEAGKETIRNAIFGLLIALGAYLILNTINPQLLSACLDNLPPAEITIEESHESSALFTPISKDKLQALGITCNEKSGGKEKLIEIATSFKDKVIYNQDIRGTISNNKVYLDCSSFIIQVYKCAKLNLPGTYTGNIFNEKNKKKISSGGTKIEGGGNLEIGDLFGWKKGENKQPDGHIMMYAGSGKYIDVHGGTKARAGIGAVGLNRSIKDELIPIINYVIPVKK